MPKDSSKKTVKGTKKGGKTSAKAWSRGANGMYECPSCHRCYTSEYHLQRHQNDVHDKQRPFACPWTSSPCFKDFANRQNLATHIRAAHTREMPYSCALCRWACPDMTGIKNHLRRHHGRNTRAADIVHDKTIGLRAQALAASVQAGVPVAPAAAPSEPEAGPSSLSVTPESTDDEPTSESEENFYGGLVPWQSDSTAIPVVPSNEYWVSTYLDEIGESASWESASWESASWESGRFGFDEGGMNESEWNVALGDLSNFMQ